MEQGRNSSCCQIILSSCSQAGAFNHTPQLERDALDGGSTRPPRSWPIQAGCGFIDAAYEGSGAGFIERKLGEVTFLELLETEEVTLINKDEALMVAKETELNLCLSRRGSAGSNQDWNAWPGAWKGESGKSNPWRQDSGKDGWKGKGKDNWRSQGKGDKSGKRKGKGKKTTRPE